MTTTEDTYVQDVATEIAEKVAAILLRARDDRPLLTIAEAAQRLGMAKRTLLDLMVAGEIGWVQVGEERSRGARKIEPAEIERFIAARRRTAEGDDE